MAIVENRSSEQGDVLIIRANVPIIGIIALTDYIDDTTEKGKQLFYKEFRFSIDGGINYSAWIELTVDNLNDVTVNSTDTFIIEYRYTHIYDESASFSFSDSTIAWNLTQIDGEIEEMSCGKTYQQSIFADFFSCHSTEVLAWCINVTEKLYRQGIVPNFIKRGDESNLNSIDKDYLDFWRTVACFFAYIVVFVRQFENFRSNDFMLSAFLEQRGIFFCDNASNADRNYLVEYYFDEMRQRGTSQIYLTKDQRNSEVDGELLRLLCYNKEIDEFIFNVYLPYTIGWCVESSSPLYKGLSKQLGGAVKGYEHTKDVEDLTKYPLFGNALFNLRQDVDKQVMSISDFAGESGIGLTDLSKRIVIDDDLSYEITFYIKQLESLQNLTFGVKAFDIANNVILTKSIDGGIDQQLFFERVQLNKHNKYYFVRGIIYGKEVSSADVDNYMALDSAYNHLQFKDGTYSIIPFISLDTGEDDISTSLSISDFESTSISPGEVRLWDIKVRPLNTNYSTGMILPNNFISIWGKKRNGRLNQRELEYRLRTYLLPYKSTFKFNVLEVENGEGLGDYSPLDYGDSYYI